MKTFFTKHKISVKRNQKNILYIPQIKNFSLLNICYTRPSKDEKSLSRNNENIRYVLQLFLNSDLLNHLESSRKIVYYMYIHLVFTCLRMNEKKKFNTFFAMSSILF